MDSEKKAVYERAYEMGSELLSLHSELEPTSAFKEAASTCGIEWGDEMWEFVEWATKRLLEGK